MTHSPSVRLDLTALTAEELQSLLGPEQALALMPEVSHARLQGQPLPGPLIRATLSLTPLEDRGGWGATPEDTRRIAALHAALLALDAQAQGAYQLDTHSLTNRLQAYTLQDHVALLRWSEERQALGSMAHVMFLTGLKHPSGGTAWVTTSSTRYPPVPALSEEIDAHLHPDLLPAELLDKHRQHVTRHGKSLKLSGEHAWLDAWQAIHALNVQAWRRRGLLTTDKTEKMLAGHGTSV